MKSFSHVRLFATPWTVACQASPSVGFFRQEYWSRFPFLSPGDYPNPGIKPGSLTLQADSLLSEPQGIPRTEGASPKCSSYGVTSNTQNIHRAVFQSPCNAHYIRIRAYLGGKLRERLKETVCPWQNLTFRKLPRETSSMTCRNPSYFYVHSLGSWKYKIATC